MGFGNPYGDAWAPELVVKWCNKIYDELGVKIISLSDTVGVAIPQTITQLFSELIPALPQVEFGAHLHTTPHSWKEKVEAAFKSGCKRFDGAIRGYGGCPMATDKLTGNMPTENMIGFFESIGLTTGIDANALEESIRIAAEIFPVH